MSSDNSKATVLVVPTDEERMMAREALRALSRSRITRVLEAQKQQPFPIEVSTHHIHLTQEHVEALFGKGHQLTKHSELSQPGQYACKEHPSFVLGMHIDTKPAPRVLLTLSKAINFRLYLPSRTALSPCALLASAASIKAKISMVSSGATGATPVLKNFIISITSGT